jgi:hypothetical protein
MNFDWRLRPAMCFVLFSALAFAKNPPAAHPSSAHPASSSMDSDYISALATANHFLYAWQSQDEEGGIVMLTDAAKHHTSSDKLDSFFSHSGTASYQVQRGKKLAKGRYVFPVALFTATAGKNARIHSYYSEIVIFQAGGDWAVDKLP